MDIQGFIEKYGQKIDDAMQKNGVKDGVIIIEDLKSALAEGVFASDPEATQFASNIASHPDSDMAKALLHYRDFLQASETGRTESAGTHTQPYNSPGLGGANPGIDPDLAGRMARSSITSADWRGYPLPPVIAANKNIAVDAIRQATSDPTMQALLVAHINLESDTFIGAPNGDGKAVQDGSYNVTPYNLNLDMVKIVCDATADRGDPYGLGQYFGDLKNVSFQQIMQTTQNPVASAAIGARTMLASIDAFDWQPTEGFVRAGRSGFDGEKALKRGEITEAEAARRWSEPSGYAPNDRQKWLNGLAAGTDFMLAERQKADGGAFSGESRAIPVDGQRFDSILLK